MQKAVLIFSQGMTNRERGKQQLGKMVKFLSALRFDAALQEAAQVDKLIEEETDGEEVLEDRLPLLGVPLSVKSSYAFQGTARNMYCTKDSSSTLSYSFLEGNLHSRLCSCRSW